jgi:GNAT superfamily N-acetyltransferase
MSPSDTIHFRDATEADLPAVLTLLEGDSMDTRLATHDLAYFRGAFDVLKRAGETRVVVGDRAGRVVATYQLTVIHGLSIRATLRAQIESVRVVGDLRSRGIGAQLMADAEDRARRAGCQLLQLTTNRTRADAARFYERLGFTPSHIGYKRDLS